MSGLYLLICTESGKFFTAPPLVAIICYFIRKQAGDQVLACDWVMRVWCDCVQSIRFIFMFFYLSVHPSSCSSMHEPWSTCMSVQPYHISQHLSIHLSIHLFMHCRFFCQSFCMYVRFSIFLSFSQLCICWTGCWFVYMSIHP